MIRVMLVIALWSSGAAAPTQPVENYSAYATDEVVAIASGRRHNCVATESGKAWCWGWNVLGQLGDGSEADSNVPVRVQGLTGVVGIAAGTHHSCAVTDSGTAWCWGNNDHGELGDGSFDYSSTPVQVAALDDVVAVSAGANYSCALAADGSAWCWGDNSYSQLGDGTTKGSPVPIRVAGVPGLTSLSAAFTKNHTCGIDTYGDGWCWGLNNYGQLGSGDLANSSRPVQVKGLEDLRVVETGGYGHSCALRAGGEPWCWGTNYWGQLGSGGGMGSEGKFPHPVRVKGIGGLRTLALGSGHSCGIDLGHSAWCWGYNGNGDLGDGTTTLRGTPGRVKSLPAVKAIAAGLGHTCSVTLDGEVYCWGWGGFGQLGNGVNTETQTTPVKVRFPQ